MGFLTKWIHNYSPADTTSEIQTVITVCLVVTVLTAFTVALRVYVRLHMLRMFTLDDWIIVASAACAIAYTSMAVEQTRWGLGLPLALRPPQNKIFYTHINLAGRFLYMLAVMGFKISLLLSYLRMVGTRAYYKSFIWVIIALCTVTHLVGILVLLFQCHPVQKSWRPNIKGTCLPNDKTFYPMAANSIVFDILVILMPIPLLWSTNIDPRKKAVLAFLFAMFAFTTVCSFLRMGQIAVTMKTGNSTGLIVWGAIEAAVGIITTCIPTLSPLLKLWCKIAKSTLADVSTLSRNLRSHNTTPFRSKTENNGSSLEFETMLTPLNRTASQRRARGTSTYISGPANEVGGDNFDFDQHGYSSDGIKVKSEVQVQVEVSSGSDKDQESLRVESSLSNYPWNGDGRPVGGMIR